MNDGQALGPVHPDDAPASYCHKHGVKYHPYRDQCWPCRRAEIHESARAEWAEVRESHIDIELAPLGDGVLRPEWEGDAHVEWQGESRLLEIQEIPSDNVAARHFTIEGGFPVEWFEDELVEALASALGKRMLAIARIVS